MKNEGNPVKAMIGLFKGKIRKSSKEIVGEIRKEWEERLEKLLKS